MYGMQTIHAGGIPMFRGTYLVFYSFYLYMAIGYIVETCYIYIYEQILIMPPGDDSPHGGILLLLCPYVRTYVRVCPSLVKVFG